MCAAAESDFNADGVNGFGYDPLFEVVEYHRTFGELGPHVKQSDQPSLPSSAGDRSAIARGLAGNERCAAADSSG